MREWRDYVTAMPGSLDKAGGVPAHISQVRHNA